MKKIITFLILIFTPVQIFANYDKINSKIVEAYDKLYIKISSKNSLNKSLIFLEGLQKKLKDYSNSSKVNYKNNKILSDIQKLNNEKIFSLKWKKLINNSESIFSKNLVLKKFKNKLYDSENFFSLENGVWYFYKVKKYIKFDGSGSINEVDIKNANLDYSKTIIFLKDDIGFASEYEKIKLVDDDILFGVPNKIEFLKLLKKYSLRGGKISNFTEKLAKIKTETEKITENSFKNDNKILEIYRYILKNISYKEDYTSLNPDFFSGIKTFENKTGVCEGYVELFYFMLAFSNIDSEILTGDVINIEDFGKVGHAWLKIGDYYYDVTFDDWNNFPEKTLEYFKIPKDLFYTNRFNEGKTPTNLKNLNLEKRQQIVRNNLVNLYDKYKNADYFMLKEIKLRKKYNINISKKLEISDLLKTKDKIYKTDLDSVIINGNKKYFSNFIYFTLLNETEFLEALLIKINYKIEDYDIFEVEKNGEKYYVISKDYSF